MVKNISQTLDLDFFQTKNFFFQKARPPTLAFWKTIRGGLAFWKKNQIKSLRYGVWGNIVLKPN